MRHPTAKKIAFFAWERNPFGNGEGDLALRHSVCAHGYKIPCFSNIHNVS